jgi:hypothetical protein
MKIHCNGEFVECDNICAITGYACVGKCYRYVEKSEVEENG